MNAIAKIVTNGAVQSVELPEGFGFDASEVRVVRVGDSIMLEAADAIDPETGLPMQRLRELIQEGIDSGPSEPLDMEKIKRDARAEWEAQR